MDLESIYALMERFERSSLTGLELEQNGTRLKLDKTVAVAAVSAVQTPAAPAPQSEAQNGTQDEGEYIKAPLVGTFYAAAGPDAEPFVKVGDQVKKGDRLLEFDLDFIRENATSVSSPVLFTSMEDNQELRLLKAGHVKPGEDLLALDIYES